MKIHGRQPVLCLWTRASSPSLTRALRQRLHNGTAHSSSEASSMASTSSKIEVAEEWAEGFASHRQGQAGGGDEGRRGGGNLASWEQFRRGEADDDGERRAVQSDWRYYARLLQGCATSKSLVEGKKVHDRMRRNQVKPDTYLSNMLISMYAKCGSIEEANKVFQAMVDKDVVSWNAMISGFAMHGRGQEAVDHYYQMQRQGFKPNKNTFVSILNAVASPAVFDFGAQLHRTITKVGFETDVTVGTALISMYNKCGNVELARKVFNEMREPNVVSWTAMISGYAQNGNSKEAFLLFKKFIRSGVEPNKISFVSILGACTKPSDLEQGEELHTYIKRAGLEQELLVGNALISMYARCGSLSNARRVFDNMRSRNLVSWNAMISGYSDAHVDDAFSLFKQMQQKKIQIQPDRFTYASLLAACADINQGKELHSQIIRTGWDSDVHVATALISMYTKCGSLERARKVFNKMPEKNVVSWNAFIAACCRHGAAMEAFDIFQQMRRGDVSPDRVTFMTLLTACSSLDDGRFLHDRIARQGMLSNDVANALISMYGRCGSVADAREVFYRIRARDLGSWNAMMATFVQHGANEAAYELFQKYRRERGRCDKYTFINTLLAIANLGDLESGRKVHALVEKSGMGDDIQILTTLIGMYAKCGSLGDACSAFNSISERDVVCWNAMLAAYARSGHNQDALNLFQHMQLSRMKLDSATYTSALKACANLGALEQGRSIHAELQKNTDTSVGNALIEMYSKCGSLSSVVHVFKKMSKRDSHSWNALIGAFCRHGHASEALNCYERMLRAGFVPNKGTFTSVLSSHGQLGEVDETFECLESIKQKWNVEPSEEHYVCMVQALGRGGLLKEAQEFIEETSLRAPLMWEALLVACRVHQNVELAEKSAEHLLDASKDQASSNAVCEQLLSVYLTAGRWENVAVLKTTMEAAGMFVKKRCTMEMNSELHTFETNPGGVDEKLLELVNQMTGKGLLLDSQEKEVLLFYQSAELLAVVYALNHSPPGTPVPCVVDSRVSDLSHKLLKFVATTYGREIFVRDAHCFHNFRPGFVCSCSDYW